MRFVFSPPAGEVSGLLTLPWAQPLDDWHDERLVEIRQRGISRHVVRFVADDGSCTRSSRSARRWPGASTGCCARSPISAFRPSRSSASWSTAAPTRTRSWSRGSSSTPAPTGPCSPAGAAACRRDSLLDALVELLVRLHLSGFFWGDCSLSNALFRADAGTYQAYLVDAETSEQHPTLTDGQRSFDLDLAAERVCGELMDLQAGELLPDDVDPIEVSEELVRRYQGLWEELNHEETSQARGPAAPHRQAAAQAQRAGLRCRRGGADRRRQRAPGCGCGPGSPSPGQSSRQLFRQTGISAEEHQARRLLNDIASFRAYKEQKSGHPVSETVAAHRWLEEIYDPVVAAIPAPLAQAAGAAGDLPRDPGAPLVHVRGAGPDVGHDRARPLYFDTVLPAVPQPLSTADASALTPDSVPNVD